MLRYTIHIFKTFTSIFSLRTCFKFALPTYNMFLSYTTPDTILTHLTSPVKIYSKPHPYSICATRIFTEICKTKCLQFKLTFETATNNKLKDEHDIFIDTLEIGILLKLQSKNIVLAEKNNHEKTLKYTHVAISGPEQDLITHGTKTSCHVAYELAKHLNILPTIVTWSFAVCTHINKTFNKIMYIPYLNHSTLFKSLQYYTTSQKLNLALAVNGISLSEAHKMYSHVNSHIKERATPLLKKFVKLKSNILDKNNMCIVKYVGSLMISAEEHLFTILHYLSLGNANMAYLCLDTINYNGLSVYEKCCDIVKRVKVKKMFGKRVGFGKNEKVDRSVLWMVNEMLGLSVGFYKGWEKYSVVFGMDVWDIERHELRDCIKTLIDN